MLPLSAGAGRVIAFRHFSTRGYTRVVLVMDRDSLDFRTGRLKDPPRVFVDIPSGRLKTGFRLPTFEKTSLAQKLRVGRPKQGVLRLIIRLLHPEIRHRAISLSSPNRIVIDLRETAKARKATAAKKAPAAGKKSAAKKSPAARKAPPGKPSAKPPGKSFDSRRFFSRDQSSRTRRPRASAGARRPGESQKRKSLNLAERFKSGLGRIVLDPGHGGRDPGATGLYRLKEKTLALDISKRVAAELQKRLPAGNTVMLTRNRDRFLELEDRTAFANKNDADVFVSIHLNSSPIRSTQGVETYLLAEASTPRALALAARESGTTVSRLADLQKILNDLKLRYKVNKSQQLANVVQFSMVAGIKRKFPSPKNLGVKRGPFYVLVGATMPSILVEMAFITNPREARLMRTSKFRQTLSEGIAGGIAKFVGVPYRRAYRPAGTGGRKSRLAESAK
jgi:N-acetylmuramoyl-L-alanine amidase